MALQYNEIVRTGLARQVADLIRNAILDGQLQVDERLPSEDELAKRFGISRPTVREALKVLAAQSLIRARRGPTGGNFVTRPDPEALARSITEASTLLVGVGTFGIDEIVAARIETETICCRLAATNRTDEDLARLQEEIDLQRDESVSDTDFCASDVRFHRALVTATGNGPLWLMMHAVIESFIPVTNMLIFDEQERRRTVDGHASVVDAIAARDADRAAQQIRRHLDGMCAVVNQALDRRVAHSTTKTDTGGETG
ncbi:FadR/GntR family transcriptional regulator [Pseudotabrizicola formosa]|uniref:FadR/GntR family transcriptional regulator n=1 Tax=Pseudotabrizicola formosa TaxID=2030009 RepID=UPI000CD2E8E9|nr:FCD domain-containing protein [Pseudotabrizicola formosa]